MPFLERDLSYTLGLLGIILAALLLGAAIYRLAIAPIQRHQRYQRRLKGQTLDDRSPDKVFKQESDDRQSLVLSLVKWIAGWGRVENLSRRMLQADIHWKPSTFLSLVGLLACGGFLLGQFGGTYLVSFALALILGLFPFAYLRFKRARKTSLFEKQLPDALELFSRSLRAGHTLASAVDLVSRQMPAPLSFEMRTAYEEQRFGLSLPAALKNITRRVDSGDLRFFITAVLIQFDTGGNLAEIMDKIARMIRARLNLKAKIRGLTAEGRFSALILGVLPLAIFLFLYFISPDYILILVREPLGRKMLLGGAVSILLGAVVMHKLIQVKV